ncbi:MAG: DMT family transporter [Nitrosomonadales bacterium]|nr:DMT family transporter [Nitrosomonadales bacterium]
MNLPSLIRLLALAAIWGGSFLFTRIGVPDLGAVILVEYRVGLAAVFLLIVAMFLHKRLNIRQHWRHYLILGVFNAALPFMLFGFAALTLTASALSILNATTPIWGAIIAAAWSRQPLSGRTVLGLGLGVVGVGVIVGLDHWAAQPGAGIAIAAALLATVCYGIATTYARNATHVDSFSNAHGSMWAASLFIAPALPFAPVATTPSIGVMLAVVALGVVCTGIAFLLYFRLVKDIGGTSTLTVTFLIPVFGILWGHLFLGEVVTPSMIFGSLTVIAGTALATGFNPMTLQRG